MPMKAGTVADFSNSMAMAMEQAMIQEYQNLKGEPLPGMGEEDRRMLFTAIAQGVVRHLKDHLDAFDVKTVHDTSTTTAPSSSIDNLNVTGTLY